MLDIRTIVFPSDGSVCAERARKLAESMAERYGASLHVLTIQVVAPVQGAAFGAIPEEDTEADTAPRNARIVEATERHPSPGHAIVEYAARVDADLVVMGTHGRSGFDRLVMGSTAEHVLRRAACPVFTVSCATEEVAEAGGVLVPHDFSAATDGALSVGAHLAHALGVRLHVVHVIEEVTLPSPYGISLDLIMTEELEARAHKAMKEHVHRVVEIPVPVTIEVRRGRAAEQILEVAEAYPPCFIVQASAGRTGLGRMVLGSVAEGVARRAACPVLTIKPHGKPLLNGRSSPLDDAEVVPRTAWADLFDDLSKRVRDSGRPWTVSVEVVAPAVGDRLEINELPLIGLTYDPRSDRLDVVVEGMDHPVTRPVAVRRSVHENGASALFEIIRQDGTRELISLRQN